MMPETRIVAAQEPPASSLARLRDLILRRHSEPGRIAAAVGLGVFIGLTPFYGLHTILAVGFAWVLRLNIAAAVISTQIGNPLFAAALIPASAWLGLFIGATPASASGAWYDPTHSEFYISWLKGSLVLGTVLGGIFGLLTWLAASTLARRRNA